MSFASFTSPCRKSCLVCARAQGWAGGTNKLAFPRTCVDAVPEDDVPEDAVPEDDIPGKFACGRPGKWKIGGRGGVAGALLQEAAPLEDPVPEEGAGGVDIGKLPSPGPW